MEGQPNLFAGVTEAGTQPGSMFNPNMFGDLIGISSVRSIVLGRGPTATTIRGLPVTGRYNGFKVTDNDNPRPVDRIFFQYNSYSDIYGSLMPRACPASTWISRSSVSNGRFSRATPRSACGCHSFRSTVSARRRRIVGDLSVHFKFAWINNRDTGDVFSTGLIVTTPTGGDNDSADGSEAPHSVLIQPWAGWVYNLDRLYLQAFHSVVIPTDTRDPTILFNSLAAGYWLYRSDSDRLLQGFVPVVEMHLNTPLNHRSDTDLIFFKDQLNLTAGGYFVSRA
jgi:hypothetical protein